MKWSTISLVCSMSIEPSSSFGSRMSPKPSLPPHSPNDPDIRHFFLSAEKSLRLPRDSLGNHPVETCLATTMRPSPRHAPATAG